MSVVTRSRRRPPAAVHDGSVIDREAALIVPVMELRHLRSFVAVAEELHFGRAAARLHVAQPAVSQTVAALERELGVTLFARNSRGVTLTEAGRALLPDASAVLDRAEAFAAAAARLRSGSAGRVTIGVSPALPPDLLTRALAAGRAVAPGTRVVARSLTRRDPAAALADGAVDLVLARGPIGAAGVTSVLVAAEPVGIAVPAGHPYATRPEISAADLNRQPLVGFARHEDPAQFDRIFDALRLAGLTDEGEVHESPAGAVEASLRLVAAGEALSLKLESETTAFGDPAIVWRPLAGVDLRVEVHVAWRIDLTNAAARKVALAIAGLRSAGGDA
ncbi:MAG TPA: LysR substrate-binding domain-containing protein [Solirubrobacterales bacterium]|nr:LysR substrate-binding domain-containing protein [Solirubrobacterales bacterium]